MSTAPSSDRLVRVLRQRNALHEMSVVVDVVSKTPNTTRDGVWWAAVREEVCRRNMVTDLAVSEAEIPTVPMRLTPRQLEILQLMSEGHTYRSAAAMLGLSMNSVKTHVHRILRVMGVHSTAHAVALALRAGIIR